MFWRPVLWENLSIDLVKRRKERSCSCVGKLGQRLKLWAEMHLLRVPERPLVTGSRWEPMAADLPSGSSWCHRNRVLWGPWLEWGQVCVVGLKSLDKWCLNPCYIPDPVPDTGDKAQTTVSAGRGPAVCVGPGTDEVMHLIRDRLTLTGLALNTSGGQRLAGSWSVWVWSLGEWPGQGPSQAMDMTVTS